jgi:anti-repressor protein
MKTQKRKRGKMSEIVLSTKSGEPVASSRQVAENFGKEHKDTLESIRQILAAENSATKSMFYETTFENRGKQYPMYLMNRDGFTLLAMGFTGKAALEWKLKYIAAFNEMEKKLAEQPQLTRSQLLATALIAAHEELEEKDKQIETMKPKALFADAVSASSQSILVGEMAKLLSQNGIQMGQNRLFQWMRENGYLIKDKKQMDYNMPTQKSMELRLFEIKETSIAHSDGHTSINKTPKVTGIGQVYFVNFFLKTEKNKKADG